jgi:hypothetical protein
MGYLREKSCDGLLVCRVNDECRQPGFGASDTYDGTV